MNRPIQFGFRIPDFPLDTARGKTFTEAIIACMDEIHPLFDSAWEADHFVPWSHAIDPTTDTLEAWTTITYLAGRYTNLKFGNIVLCQSYRPPALLAKMTATFQALSSGRLILAIGAGWKEDEYHAYGYHFPSVATRFEQLEESVQILRLMWTQPKTTFAGKHYQITDAICEPKPDPIPPLMIGGGGKKKTLRLTAQYADWWNFPGGTVEHYADLLETLREHCQNLGSDYDGIVKTWLTDCVAIAPTHEAALQQAQAHPLYDPATAVVGTPDEVTAHFKRFTDLGVSHFILRFADFPHTAGARLFAKEVMPRFSGERS